MNRALSITSLILPLLALAPFLSAQTIIVDKPAVTLNAQVGGSPVSTTITISSSNGSAIPFTLSYPTFPWLKANGSLFGVAGTTPAVVTLSADPTGLSAGTVSANIIVQGGSSQSNPPIVVSFTISAIGVSPSSAAFSYTVGSPTFPASQTLTLTGASTACTATASATSGGSWFTLLQNSCTSPGSLTVLINNAIVAGLAPGTYSGTVTVTPNPAGASPAVVVPLTLTVSPTPPITVNPTSLVFNWQTGVTAPNPSQVFTVSTTSTQPLTYGITASVETGSWISVVNPSSGTFSASSPAQITLTLNPNGLAVGTYNGKLTLQTPGGSPTQQDIPVRLIIASTPLLNVPNATLNFAYQLGAGLPASQSVTITATSGSLTYAVSQSANSPWLSVPNSGSTAAPLSISVNPTGLLPGTYSATVNVVSATPGSTAQTIPVVLKVTNDPTINSNVSSLSFPYQIGLSTPAAQTVRVTSSTGVLLNYSAALSTTTCGATWLLLNGATGTVTGNTDDTLTVSIAPAGLVAGTCTGKLTITATNPSTGLPAVNSPLNVDVTLYVSATALLVLQPASAPVFTVGVGSTSVLSQNISLASTDSTVLSYSVAFQANNGGNWLFVAPQSGTTALNNVITINAIPSGLAVGSYSGTVTITAAGPGGAAVANSPVTVPITLNVTGGSITLSSTDLNFEQALGGTPPASQTVTIGSTSQTLNYSAVANSNNAISWLSVSPANGNTSSNPQLTISVDGTKLTPGVTYAGTIAITSPGAGNSPATINVRLKINPGTISAPTTTLTFVQVAGGTAPPAQTIAVNGTPASLNFTVAAATQNGGPWLAATPAAGATPGSVQVQIANAGSLAVGQYAGTVTISSAGATGSPITVPVVLNVVPAAVLAASPTSLTFASIIGSSAPPAQSVQITSTGTTSSVPFTVQVQADGNAGQWLVVNPTSSVAPASLSVSVSPSTLAAGTYNGRLIITSLNAVAPLTIPVTLTVTAIPKPVVNAVANAANYSTGAVSPGENIVIFGTGVGPAQLTNATVANDTFPTLVGATRVLFDNTPAPIIYASGTQTSVMVPYGVQGRTTTSIVVEYSGVQSTPLTYNVVSSAPGVYTQNAQGTGPGAILNQDGITVNGANSPEKRGNVIAIYMTGEGQTSPQGADGAVIPAIASALKKPILPVTVTIAGIDAVVAYAGSAPGLISGVMQVNVTIPLNAPTGTQPVVVTVGTVRSQSGANAATVAIN